MDKYHQKYASLPDEELQKRIQEKKQELISIFSKVPFDSKSQIIKLAVMGCGDKRFVRAHKKIFSEVLGRKIEATTFDITTDHLFGEERIVKHDCTFPLPDGPYTITYAHVLFKFIETEKQWNVIKNSYESLEPNGIAIHVMDKEDYETKSERLPNGQYSVPLERWVNKLREENIKFYLIQVKYGQALVLTKVI